MSENLDVLDDLLRRLDEQFERIVNDNPEAARYEQIGVVNDDLISNLGEIRKARAIVKSLRGQNP
jgi:hypothetical protein